MDYTLERLLGPYISEQLRRVLESGVEKHGSIRGWEKVGTYTPKQLVAKMGRHFGCLCSGKQADHESSATHWSHIATLVLILGWLDEATNDAMPELVADRRHSTSRPVSEKLEGTSAHFKALNETGRPREPAAPPEGETGMGWNPERFIVVNCPGCDVLVAIGSRVTEAFCWKFDCRFYSNAFNPQEVTG